MQAMCFGRERAGVAAVTRAGRRHLGCARAAFALAMGLLSLSPRTDAGGAPDGAGSLLEALQMRRPEGAGPFPAIMLVPVCSGMSKKEHVAHYREMGAQLNGMGYLVVHVDYVAARRLTDACGGLVPTDDIAADIAAVAKHLRSLARVDPARIDVIGESLGGGGVLAALGRPGPDDRPPFRRAVVFYPVCRGVSPPRVRAEVLMLFGGLDGMTPAESCQEITRRFPKPADVQLRVYPDARHGFNLAHLPQAPSAGQPTWTPAYHPAAAKAAWEDAARFLSR
jgi:dienelactone hydrolase